MRFSDFFETRTRTNGNKFMCLNDNAPEFLSEFIRSIHFDYFEGALPNDWIYDQIHTAFYDIERSNLNEDQFNELEGDAYNCDLIRWLDNPFALAYCDSSLEMRYDSFADTIRDAQANAIRVIYQAVWDFIQEQVDGQISNLICEIEVN